MSASASAPAPPLAKRPRRADAWLDAGDAADVAAGLVTSAAGVLPPIPLLVDDDSADDDDPDASSALLLSWNGSCAFVWRAADCARLRALGRLCASPVGLCAARLATRGKAAAVPLVLSDEELAVAAGAAAAAWRTRAVDSRTGAPLACGDLLAASAARAPPGWRARRAVFADLWRRGYRCTSGLKFGVDYLAYTADASHVHAAFMVIVREDRGDADIAALDLVAKARVATTALKICVMAYGCGDGGGGGAAAGDAAARVRYAAFKRMGPGSAVFEAVAVAAPRAAAEAVAAAATAAANAAAAAASVPAHPPAPENADADDASALTYVPAGAVDALIDRGVCE